MAVLGQISGLPGTGKTFSLKSCDPLKTFFFDCDGKGMAWTGWKKDYNKERKNYLRTSDMATIKTVLKGISEKRPEIQLVVIDTQNSITSDEVMLSMRKGNHDQWRELAIDVYDLQNFIRTELREDLIVFIFAHIEPYVLNGITYWRTKYDGKMLTKLNMNGKLNYNLYIESSLEGGKRQTYFVTQSDGFTEARSTWGALPDRMEANMAEVVRLIRIAESLDEEPQAEAQASS